jgi:RNA polymerase sigma-70 factor (ECF subfamily)
MALDEAWPGLSEVRTASRLARLFDRAEPDWDAVYADQLPRVYNFFRYRCGDHADAEDLTGRTFEKAWRSRHRYRRDVAAFSTWLMSIARNVAVDHLRSRRLHVPLDEAANVQTGVTPEDAAARRSDAAHLSRLLKTLPERDRDLVALKYGAGLTNRQIAQATGLSESNVGTLLHRITLALRSQWTAGERP